VKTREELNDLTNEELLGAESMKRWRRAEIDRRLSLHKMHLKGLSDEDLLGADFIQELRDEEIELRLEDDED
jgi:hypothetical protein